MYPKHENRNVGSAKVERELVRSSVVVVHINTIKAATPLLLTRVPPPCAPKTAVLRSYLPIKQIVCLVLFHFNDFLGRFWLKKSSSFVSRKKSKNMNDHLLIFNLPMLTYVLFVFFSGWLSKGKLLRWAKSNVVFSLICMCFRHFYCAYIQF